MHWGTGAALGALRGIWSASGLRGWRASVWHTSVRLATDQTLENAGGVGSPPWTWSARDRMADICHKAVYSLVTGAVADRLSVSHRTGTDPEPPAVRDSTAHAPAPLAG